MKVKTQKYTFKALALMLALLFTVLFIPVGELVAWAKIAEEYTDYSYMTIGTEDENVNTTVYTGATYTIANGYIGGNTSFRIGDTNINDTQLSAEHGGVTLIRSDITVTYGASTTTSGSSSASVEVTPIENGKGGYGTFTASRTGTYTVTYSYEYSIGDKTYYNYYDMTVTSSLSEINVNLEDNTEDFFPSIIPSTSYFLNNPDGHPPGAPANICGQMPHY